MIRSGKLRWTVRSVAVPLLLSLVVHGFLLLALWYWPMRTHSPTLTIQSTRISLDTCVLASPSSTLLDESELLGPGVDVDTALAPRIEEPPPSSTPRPSDPAPVSRDGTGNESGTKKGSEHAAPPDNGSGSLFPLPTTAASVVYVLDRSLSMATDRKLEFACGELIASLRQLPATARFQVIDYNEFAAMLIVNGRNDLLPAEPGTVAQAIAHLQELAPAGKTNYVAALSKGVDLHADVLYFLTDADDLKPEEVAVITRRNQRTVIHTIELTHRRLSQPDSPLARLAHDNRGTCRRVSIRD